MKARTIQLLVTFVMLAVPAWAQLLTPLEYRGYQTPSSAAEIDAFLKQAAAQSDLISLEEFGFSGEGQTLKVVKVLHPEMAAVSNKLRILVFAQQHGNEPSGKEAILLLIKQFALGQLDSLLSNIELWLVPQINPDGGEAHSRQNATGIDLNRDHVLMQAPETFALHRLFAEFLPHVTIDMHEYQPFRESWREFGAYKTFDVQVGTSTNPMVAPGLTTYSLKHVLPAIAEALQKEGYTFQNYIVGPPPDRGRTRHSTIDINDGRQSFGIQNTLSFIFEGINGRDGFSENLENRSHSQFVALNALIGHVANDYIQVSQLVNESRRLLLEAKPGEDVGIRMEHFPMEGHSLDLLLESAATGKDTLVRIVNYHPHVKVLETVKRPKAYLIPKADSLLMDLVHKHGLVYRDYKPGAGQVFAYKVYSADESIDEELPNWMPVIEKQKIAVDSYDYIEIPVSQLKCNFMVLSFEPRSMIGLHQNYQFGNWMYDNTIYPVLRLE